MVGVFGIRLQDALHQFLRQPNTFGNDSHDVVRVGANIVELSGMIAAMSARKGGENKRKSYETKAKDTACTDLAALVLIRKQCKQLFGEVVKLEQQVSSRLGTLKFGV